MIPTPKGMILAPPYAEERITFNSSNESYDFVQIRNLDCWNETFSVGEIDWVNGWRDLWLCASQTVGNGTDFKKGQIGLELQLYFEDNEFASLGVGYNGEFEEDTPIWESRALDLISKVCASDRPIAGCVAIVVDPDDEKSRPCLTMLVSGPGGAKEATMIIRQALANQGLTVGVAIRTIRSETVGVVKVPFIPEMYLQSDFNSFGVDWRLWSKLTGGNAILEWNSAALLWCDCVIAAVTKVKEKAPFMVDSTYFDFVRLVPLGTQNSIVKFDQTQTNLAELMRLFPHEFLFDDANE